jgi:DNA invertase Pin-like site-specific DNA recombinase
MNLQLRAAAYVRVSSAACDHPLTLFGQTQVIRRWAEQNGYELVRVYSDIGPAHTADRPGFQLLLAATQAGHIDAILVTNWTRLCHGSELFIPFYVLTRSREVELIALDMRGGVAWR